MPLDCQMQKATQICDGYLQSLANDPSPAATPKGHLLDNYSKELADPHRRPLTLDTTIVKPHHIQGVLEFLCHFGSLGVFALVLSLSLGGG